MKILIAGCGDVGTAAALRLTTAGHAVTGLRRNAAALPDSIERRSADLLDPSTLTPLAGTWDVVIYAPTPGERNEAGYRSICIEGLENLAEAVSARRVIFVSSTAVYGEDGGAWVDETSLTDPTGFNGRVLLEAESLARMAAPESVAVRLGGIYGPGRDRMLRVARKLAGEATQAEPRQWTNRIHRDDAGALVAFCATMSRPAPCYNGVDDRPVPRFEVLDWLAARLGLPRPVPVAGESRSMNKRVSNRRIRGAGFDFFYPDYQAGYGALIEAGETGQ